MPSHYGGYGFRSEKDWPQCPSEKGLVSEAQCAVTHDCFGDFLSCAAVDVLYWFHAAIISYPVSAG